MPTWKLLPVGAVALAIALTPAATVPAIAAPLPSPGMADASATSAVTKVGRRHRHRRHHGRRHDGGALAFGLGLGIVGALIASQAYRGHPGYYDDDDDGAFYVAPGYADPYDPCGYDRYCRD